MPSTCEYCNTEFTTSAQKRRHQKTAKYCLKIQQNQGLTPITDTYTCIECGEEFTLKHALKRHQLRHHSERPIVQNVGILNNIQNTINIAIYGSTASVLTPEYLQKHLVPLLVDAVGDGVEKLTEIATRNALINEKGNPRVIVTDRSRGNLKIRYDHGDELDIKGSKTTALISCPMMQAAQIALKSADKKSIVLDSLKEIDNLQDDNKAALAVFVRTLPGTFDSAHAECEAQMKAIQEQREKTRQEIKLDIEKAEQEIMKLTETQATDALSKYLGKYKFGWRVEDNSILWDGDNLYCWRELTGTLRTSFGLELRRVELIGYSNTKEGKIFDLTSKELRAVKNFGISYFLEQKYRGIDD